MGERAATFDERHEALLKLEREFAIEGRLPHVAGPRGTLFLRDFEPVVGTTHDRKTTPFLRVQRRTAEQFGKP